MIEATRRARPAHLLLAAALLAGCGDGGGGGAELVISTGDREVKVSVEIADSPEERGRGLMGRQGLALDAGMVFLHEEPEATQFTMRGTLIPLSLAVWGEDGRIAAILDMVPCEVESCPAYDPGVAWVGAVEVNRGFFLEQGVGIGDRVRLVR